VMLGGDRHRHGHLLTARQAGVDAAAFGKDFDAEVAALFGPFVGLLEEHGRVG